MTDVALFFPPCCFHSLPDEGGGSLVQQGVLRYATHSPETDANL